MAPHPAMIGNAFSTADLKVWLEAPEYRDLPQGALSSAELSAALEIALAQSPGSRRSRRLQALTGAVSPEVLPDMLLRLAASSVVEDSALATKAAFSRGHEMHLDDLVKLAETAPAKSSLKSACVAIAAKAYLDSHSLDVAIAWARQRATPELLPSIINCAAIGAQWEAVLALPKNSDYWDQELLQEVSRHLGYSHPDGAAARTWIMSWGDTPAGTAPVQAFVSSWLQQEPADASAWVKDLPAGPHRDAGAAGVAAYSMQQRDAEAAPLWINLIADQTLRAGMLEDLKSSGLQSGE